MNCSAVEMESVHWLVQLTDRHEDASRFWNQPFKARTAEIDRCIEMRGSTDKVWRRKALWFANINNHNTRRSYRKDLQEFMGFIGIAAPEDFRLVTRAHVVVWRTDLKRRQLAGNTPRRKLAALSSLFEYLCERNAVSTNPVDGVKRPKV